ncbi:MAG TPA: hypothetical protein PLB95_12605 [Syntrophales bacterium]|nr:hypothetical protein [Syntrophales bacterium]HQB14868.1 hypothetical protein [Syntrophales bacterium]
MTGKTGNKEIISAAGSQGVEAYIARYHELLEKPGRIVVATLEPVHRRIDSSLHRSTDKGRVNLSAFVYAAERLPSCLPSVNRIVIASTEEVFEESGFGHVLDWERAAARRRRRRSHYDGEQTLAIFVTSISDLDDLIPSLCAYQLEWNAIHRRLRSTPLGADLAAGRVRAMEAREDIRRALEVNSRDLEILLRFWSEESDHRFRDIAAAPKEMIVDRLPLQQLDFEVSVTAWLDEVIRHFSDLDFVTRPVYLVSSNTHSLANLVSGYVRQRRDEIIAVALDEIIDDDDEWLRRYRQRLEDEEEEETLRNDFLYYALRAFLEKQPDRIPEKIAAEVSVGVRRFTPDSLLHLEAQIIELEMLDPGSMDPGVSVGWGSPRPGATCPAPGRAPGMSRKAGRDSDAESEIPIVFNIDYPLGFSAYYLMKTILGKMKRVQGVFILGKSAAIIGRLGDIMIPEEVRDVHSGRNYRFRNVFSTARLVPYLSETAVFDDQRTLTVRGTFLHSRRMIDDYRGDDFTGIEMEAGPYLSALAEHLGIDTSGKSAVVHIPPLLPMGILFYTSDTPYNLRASLLSRRLGLKGIEATYACSRAILAAVLTNSRLLPTGRAHPLALDK